MEDKNKFGILLVSRNNPKMISEWFSQYNYDDYEILNIDESTDKDSAILAKSICNDCGIEYQKINKGKSGLANNVIQANTFFKTKGIEWILYMHHDAYPMGDSLSKIDSYIQKKQLKNFGVIGFNVLHGVLDLPFWNQDKTPLRTTARGVLGLGDGWYRCHDTSRINYENIKKPFAVESVMWSTALVNLKNFQKYIEIDERFVMFHAWDDVAYQFLNQNIYNIVIPDIVFGHDQTLKLKYDLPNSSPQGQKKNVERLYGRSDSLDSWKSKWGFSYDINKSKRFGLSLQNPFLIRIMRYFFRDKISSLPTVARDEYLLVREKYRNTLLDEFYEHDPKNGAIKYFDL